MSTIYYTCPICEDEEAIIGIDWDVDIDVEGGEAFIMGAYPYPSLIKCDCGFTMSDPEEVEILLGENYENLVNDFIKQDQPEPEYYRDEE